MRQQAGTFYLKMARIARMSPARRRSALTKVSRPILRRYLAALDAITPSRADEIGLDGRTLGQVVGHIVEWERWTLLAAGQIMAGVQSPHMISMQGYTESGGGVLEFGGVDDFNYYQSAKYSTRPWGWIHSAAIHTAKALHLLFATEDLIPLDYLQKTEPFEWPLPTGENLKIPFGWYIWMAALEHEAIEHAGDLYPTTRAARRPESPPHFKVMRHRVD